MLHVISGYNQLQRFKKKQIVQIIFLAPRMIVKRDNRIQIWERHWY